MPPHRQFQFSSCYYIGPPTGWEKCNQNGSYRQEERVSYSKRFPYNQNVQDACGYPVTANARLFGAEMPVFCNSCALLTGTCVQGVPFFINQRNTTVNPVQQCNVEATRSTS
ncbi:unnamed protein product [Ectocarpus sp. 12 AP-2014]